MTSKIKILVLASGLLLSSGVVNISLAKSIIANTHMVQDSVALIKKQIAKYPDSLALHERFLKSSDVESADIERQYVKWAKKYNKSAVVPFAYGNALMDKYNHQAEKWLTEAVTRNPLYAAAWYELSMYAEFSGDQVKSLEYLRNATQVEPDNANYAFYYANRASQGSREAYEKSTLEFVRRFPKSQRAAQALYWLANRSDVPSRRTEIYELLRREYPVSEYAWSAAAMSEYFSMLLNNDLTKANQLAKDLSTKVNDDFKAVWTTNLSFSEQIAEVKMLLDADRAKEAIDIINSIAPQRGSNAQLITLLKVEATAKDDGLQDAYDMLLDIYAKNLDKSYLSFLNDYGVKLGKSNIEVHGDIRGHITKKSVKATPFELEQYLESGNLSLEDLKGKVILLTYWYPGCGPCRAEFPHFENVLSKFNRQDVVYLGINIVRKQDDFVKPFMTESKNTFIPLKEDDKRDKGNLDNRGVAPVNFLIDKDGNIAFSNFKINGKNEDMLETMISLLL